MRDFICMETVKLPGASRKRQNEKVLLTLGFETNNPEIKSLMLYQLS